MDGHPPQASGDGGLGLDQSRGTLEFRLGEATAKVALNKAIQKLPIKARIITREEIV